MISEKMVSMISEQIRREYESAYLYLEVADFYDSNGLSGFANWFKVQAREEEDHAMIFYEYLHLNGAKVCFYDIKARNKTYHDFSVPLKEALIHEEFITESIIKIYEQAEKENDYGTQILLQWFIGEQQEEEASARGLIEQSEIFAGTPGGLYQLDKDYGMRTYGGCDKLKKMEA